MTTNGNDKPELRARARELRDTGYTRDQIRVALGLPSDWAVTQLLDREPARHPGLRTQAKDDLRKRARELRLEGHTYPEIAEELGVSKSSVSLWVRDLPAPDSTPEGKARSQERRTAAIQAVWRKKQEVIDRERQRTRSVASRQVGHMDDRDVLLAGAVAYWCEGSKSKPWNRNERVIFTNSDTGLIQLFLRFLDVAGIKRELVTFRVNIHERADVAGAVQYWSRVVDAPEERFLKTTLKRHNPKTVRKNVHEDYRGCLIISVNQSASLYRRIEGWARAAMGVGIVEPEKRESD